VWVRGEVQRLPADAARRKHVYFELHATGGSGAAAGFQIPAAILDWDRQRFGLGRYLDGSDPDFQIRNQLEVCLECRVDFYPPYGKVSLKVIGVDKAFSLGQLEARRRAVMAYLEGEKLLELNSAIPMPMLPLRIGLITSAGSAAEKDFRTGLDHSPYGFDVDLVDCRMQGEQTEGQIIQALSVLAARGLDVVVITRGGGSRADLSWFDQQELAVAIARCPLPVVTAIGHEIDRSIADVVAHHACKTPTAAAEFLIDRMREVNDRVDGLEASLRERVGELLATAAGRIEQATRRLERLVSRRVDVARHGLGARSARLATVAVRGVAAAASENSGYLQRLVREAMRCSAQGRRRLDALPTRLTVDTLLASWSDRESRLTHAAGRLERLADGALARNRRRLDGLSDSARLLDPQRLLERGYTLTTAEGGRHLTSVADIEADDLLHTRFHDGAVVSRVAATERHANTKQATKKKATRKKGVKGGGKKGNPGQETLFQ